VESSTRQPRRLRHVLMFALAYGAIAAAVLFARPFETAQAVDIKAPQHVQAGTVAR
jgi:hypothetical protein